MDSAPRIRQSVAADVEALAPLMRKRDADEVMASSGSTPLQALTAAFNAPGLCYTAESGGVPFAMFGVVGLSADYPYIGSPWLLGSDALIKEHLTFFMRNTRPYLQRFHMLYPLLLNATDVRNTEIVAWLRWAGFSVDKIIEKYGHEGRPFHLFTRQ